MTEQKKDDRVKNPNVPEPTTTPDANPSTNMPNPNPNEVTVPAKGN